MYFQPICNQLIKHFNACVHGYFAQAVASPTGVYIDVHKQGETQVRQSIAPRKSNIKATKPFSVASKTRKTRLPRRECTWTYTSEGKRKFDKVLRHAKATSKRRSRFQLQARREERGFPDGSVHGRTRARGNASSTKYCAANQSGFSWRWQTLRYILESVSSAFTPR